MKKLNLLLAFSLILSAFVFFACSKEDNSNTSTATEDTTENSTEVKATDRGARTCCAFYLSALQLSSGTTATLTITPCLGAGLCKESIRTLTLSPELLGTKIYCCPGSVATLTLNNSTPNGGSAQVSFYGQNQKAGATGFANVNNLRGTLPFNFDPCFNSSFEMAIQ
jgi:hypothetical protein